MAERLVTLAQLREGLEDLLRQVEAGETVVLVDGPPGAERQRAVLLGAAAHAHLASAAPGPGVDATVAGVAGGLVAGAGATISSVTGQPAVAKGARRLGRRLGRALGVGIDALTEDQGKGKPPG